MKPLEFFASHCSKSIFPGFPSWSKNLKFDESDCTIQDFSLDDIWIVVANFVQMALFIAGLLSVIFIILGGIMFVTSAGNPDNVQRARKTLANAALGLVISVLASTIIGYVVSVLG